MSENKIIKGKNEEVCNGQIVPKSVEKNGNCRWNVPREAALNFIFLEKNLRENDKFGRKSVRFQTKSSLQTQGIAVGF